MKETYKKKIIQFHGGCGGCTRQHTEDAVEDWNNIVTEVVRHHFKAMDFMLKKEKEKS